MTFFNSQTSGEQITENWSCTGTANTACLMISASLSCVCKLFLLLLTFLQKIITRWQSGWTCRPLRMANYLVPRNVMLSWPLNYWLYGQMHHLAKRTCIPSPNHLNFEKMVWEFVQCTSVKLLCPTQRWVKLFLSHWWHTTLLLFEAMYQHILH